MCLLGNRRYLLLAHDVVGVRLAHGHQVLAIQHPLDLECLVITNVLLDGIGKACHNPNTGNRDRRHHHNTLEDLHRILAIKNRPAPITVDLKLELILGIIVVKKASRNHVLVDLPGYPNQLLPRGTALPHLAALARYKAIARYLESRALLARPEQHEVAITNWSCG